MSTLQIRNATAPFERPMLIGAGLTMIYRIRLKLALWKTRCQVDSGETPSKAVFAVADRFVQANTVPLAQVLN